MQSVVLIDTWWNVNEEESYIKENWGTGFNRYMVECKSPKPTEVSTTAPVLIDTWWNVNGIHFFMNREDVVKFQ